MNQSQASSPESPSLIAPHIIEQFILDSPIDLPVSQLFEFAKTKGFNLDVLQVHRIRDRERRRAAQTTAPNAPTNAEESAAEGDEEEGDEEEGDDEAPESAEGVVGAGASGQREAGDGSSPPKRRGRKLSGLETRTGFVRSLPLDTPVEEVIRLGREQYGHKLDEKSISAIRSKINPNRRRRQSKKSKEAAATVSPVTVALPAPVVATSPVSVAPPAPIATASPTASTSPTPVVVASPAAVFREAEGVDVRDVEEEFARLVVEIGLMRAEQLLRRVKERLAQLVRS